MIKLLIWALIAYLWYLGGQSHNWYRDTLIPLILGAFCAILAHSGWVFLWVFIGYSIMRLGYGNYDPVNDPKPSFLADITHDRKGWKIRGVHAFLVSAIGGGIVAKYFGLDWQYFLYVLYNTLGAYWIVRRGTKVKATDLSIGAMVGSIIFLL